VHPFPLKPTNAYLIATIFSDGLGTVVIIEFSYTVTIKPD
jgi:hypothetical protein